MGAKKDAMASAVMHIVIKRAFMASPFVLETTECGLDENESRSPTWTVTSGPLDSAPLVG
jgi:hypothetical protein